MHNYYLIILFGAGIVGGECRSIISTNFDEADDGSEATKYDYWYNITPSNNSDYWANSSNVDELLLNNTSEKIPSIMARVITSEGPIFDQSLDKFTTTNESNVTNRKETAAQVLEQLLAELESWESDDRFDKKNGNEVADVVQTESTLSNGNDDFILIDEKNWLDELRQFGDGDFVGYDGNENNESHVKSRFDNTSTSELPRDQSSEGSENPIQHESYELDDMITEFQNDVRGIQKYFGKLCSKHRTES